MHHKVLDLIALSVSPERLVIYKDTVTTLLLKDVALMDVTFDNFYNSMFNNMTTYNLSDWDNLLIQHLRTGIEEFGVYIDMNMVDANAVEPMTYMLQALYGFDQYPDPIELVALLDSPIPNNELIAELVINITAYNKDAPIMELISDVSGSLLRRMRVVANEAVENLDAMEEDYTHDDIETLRYLAYLSDKWGVPSPLGLLQQGEVLGKDIATYGYAMLPDESQYTPDMIAKIIVLSAVMAKTPKAHILTHVGEYITARFEDKPDIMLAVSRALHKLDLEMPV